MSNTCWMLTEEVKPPVMVLLGRYGDLIQLLPAFKSIQDRTGVKPVVIVSHEYASVLEGVSYVTPHPIMAHWYEGMPHARELAEYLGGGTNLKWWHEPDILKQEQSGHWVLQSHGHNWGVNMAAAPNYGASMWQRAGFTIKEMMELPLLFDRRDYKREEALFRFVTQGNRRQKPVLLYNFTGISSQFGYTPEVMNMLRPMEMDFYLVNLSLNKAHRIYDLVGLMDAAAGMITIDTATLHLAAASRVPYIALSVDGWTSSVPKGNVVLEVKYSQAKQRLSEIQHALNRFR